MEGVDLNGDFLQSLEDESHPFSGEFLLRKWVPFAIGDYVQVKWGAAGFGSAVVKTPVTPSLYLNDIPNPGNKFVYTK